MPEHIAYHEVTKRFASGAVALDAVSFDVEAGTFVVLLGPSGSGKTTLLRTLAGIERISTGTIHLNGALVAGDDHHVPPERRSLSMVFQDYALWPHLVALDNVAFALRRHGLTKPDGRATAQRMLERVGLAHLAARYPSELSGGEQQRVALARALVANTGLVLCDEPLSNLDADLRERMRVEISELVREAGATTVYITHDQAEAFALADRVGVLESGSLVQYDVPEAIYLWPATPFVARFTGLAAELAVELLPERVADGTVAVRPVRLEARAAIECRVAEQMADWHRGLVMVRPSAVQLASPEDPRSQLVGRVADVAFRGRSYEHVVDLADGTRVSGVLAEQRGARGDLVGLRLDPSGALVFPGAQPRVDGAGGKPTATTFVA